MLTRNVLPASASRLPALLQVALRLRRREQVHEVHAPGVDEAALAREPFVERDAVDAGAAARALRDERAVGVAADDDDVVDVERAIAVP